MTERLVAALARVAEHVARPDAPALVVTHGGALRAVVAVATGSLPAPVKNGALWRVAWEGGITAAEPVAPEAGAGPTL
jgi:broad specificity phosphatase PhoE